MRKFVSPEKVRRRLTSVQRFAPRALAVCLGTAFLIVLGGGLPLSGQTGVAPSTGPVFPSSNPPPQRVATDAAPPPPTAVIQPRADRDASGANNLPLGATNGPSRDNVPSSRATIESNPFRDPFGDRTPYEPRVAAAPPDGRRNAAGPAASGNQFAGAMELRLRFAWGGGESRRWRTQIEIDEGEFRRDHQGLSLEHDAPGSYAVYARSVHVAPRRPTGYDGLDVTVLGSPDAMISIDIAPFDQPERRTQTRIRLADLIAQFHNSDLDDRGNRLVVRRAPGDELRILFNRDSLVFSPQEPFSFVVQPNETGLVAETPVRAILRLVPARSSQTVWSHVEELTVGADGKLPLIRPSPLTIPATDGAYDLIVALFPRKLTDVITDRLTENLADQFTEKFLKSKPLVERKLQLVVVGDEPVSADAAPWSLVGEIDPTSEHWWDRLSRVPGFTRLPGISAEPIGNQRIGRQTRNGAEWMELGVDGWQAYPLPIARRGRPHLLEIEFPADAPQSLGVSLVEADAAGQVAPIGLDSGIDVPARIGPPLANETVHRVVFWPRTDSPLLLLTNRNSQSAAWFGRIRVLAGPVTLPDAVTEVERTNAANEPTSEPVRSSRFPTPSIPLRFRGQSPEQSPWFALPRRRDDRAASADREHDAPIEVDRDVAGKGVQGPEENLARESQARNRFVQVAGYNDGTIGNVENSPSGNLANAPNGNGDGVAAPPNSLREPGRDLSSGIRAPVGFTDPPETSDGVPAAPSNDASDNAPNDAPNETRAPAEGESSSERPMTTNVGPIEPIPSAAPRSARIEAAESRSPGSSPAGSSPVGSSAAGSAAPVLPAPLSAPAAGSLSPSYERNIDGTNGTTGPAVLSSDLNVAGERLFTAWLDKPYFNDNFTATEARDERTGRSLDDWQTFYEGASRLVEYLKFAGYNSAVITVAAEGSAIYPSQRLEPTPKYDNGVFFYTGQDARRKDVLEMLFRMFDREGLRLIPAVHFSTPLPSLERLKGEDRAAGVGLEPVGPDGQTYMASIGAPRGVGPYYNVFDPRVQAAVREVIGELTMRYDHHASFAGVSIDLGPDSYLLPPGEMWGLDRPTVARFAQQCDPRVRPDIASFQRTVESLQGVSRDAWRTWRTREVASFLQQLHRDVAVRRPTVRLLLNTSSYLADSRFRTEHRPALVSNRKPDDLILGRGLDLSLLANEPGVVAPRPHRRSALGEPMTRTVDDSLNEQFEIDQRLSTTAGVAPPAAIFLHDTTPIRLTSFDAASPFGRANTETWLLAHLAPALSENRRRFVQALARRDHRQLIDGGMMMPLGQEDSIRRLAMTFRSLPNAPFADVGGGDPSFTEPLVVRRLDRERETIVYIVNPFPWPVAAEFDLQIPNGCRVAPLGQPGTTSTTLAASAAAVPGSPSAAVRWPVRMEPFDLLAVSFDAPRIGIRGWRTSFDDSVIGRLKQEIRRTQQQAAMLVNPPVYAATPNPGFEDGDGLAPSDWIHARGPGVTVHRDASLPHSGAYSLHLRSEGPVVWVRSQPFPPPHTGRAYLLARLRTRDRSAQPPLRLAIEARTEDGAYYRWSAVGAGTPFAIGTDWGASPFLAPLELPIENVSQLRIGFDLMGEGEVWIDDVQLQHLYFHDNDPSSPSERSELRKLIAAADYQLERRHVADAYAFLRGYWPRMLSENLPIATPAGLSTPSGRTTSSGRPDVAATPQNDSPRAPTGPVIPPTNRSQPDTGDSPTAEASAPPIEDSADQAPAERTSRWQKMRSYVPKSLWPFQ